MPHLSIPLSRHSTTTRRHRWVVWPSLLILILVIVWIFWSWWFTQSDVGQAAPDGTVAILHLQPGHGHWTDLLNVAGDWPAVSDKGITLRDLAGITHGDISLYFFQNGSWESAIRTSSKKIPHSLIDSEGITVQDAGNGLLLLGDRSYPIMRISLPNPAPWLDDPFETSLGTFYEKQGTSWVSGYIQEQKNGWILRLPKFSLTKNPWKSIPSGTLAILVAPIPASGIDLSGVTLRMDALLQHMDVPSIQTLADAWVHQQGFLVLQNDNQGLGVLLAGPSSSISKMDGKRLLTAADALEMPSTRLWTLPDQTKAQELIVDPSSVSIEERTILGTKVLEGQSKPGKSWFFAENGPFYTLSNRESLVTDWLRGNSQGPFLQSSCQTQGAIFIDMKNLFKVSSETMQHEQPNTARILTENFEHFSAYNGALSTNIQLCF